MIFYKLIVYFAINYDKMSKFIILKKVRNNNILSKINTDKSDYGIFIDNFS